MSIRTYHDFILFTYNTVMDEHGESLSFNVQVFDSPAGQGEGFRAEELHYQGLQEEIALLERRCLDGKIEEQKALGRRLAGLLLPEQVGEMLQESYKWLKEDEALRVRLRLDTELAHLPWEYLYLDDDDQHPFLHGFIALNPRISIVRHEALAIRAVPLAEDQDQTGPTIARPVERPAMPTAWLPPPPAARNRRIVVAMATPQPYGDYPPLKQLSREQIEIREALGKVKGVEVSYRPEYHAPDDYQKVPGITLPDLQAVLSPRTDILHFSGHGHFEKELAPGGTSVQGQGWLILADEQNQAKPVSADEVQTLIVERGVRLVVLEACESGERDSFRQGSSIAVSLLMGKVPCVVAMQFTVDDRLAAAFSEAFYEALVAGLEVDEAVAMGRAAVWNCTLGDSGLVRDWGVPVLYLRTPGGRVFQPISDEKAREEAAQRSQERFDLNTAWWKWMAEGDVASVAQLERLAAASTLRLSPVQVLLLLRSAVKQDLSPAPWLERLRQGEERSLALLGKVEAEGAPAEAARILRLGDALPRPRPPDVAPLAWTAACHPDECTRQVAALALTAVQGREQGLREVDKAANGLGRRRSWRCRAELRGTLADADPEIERLNRKLSLGDRLGIWGWRALRRVRRDRQPLVRLIAGGAIGAGVGLGLLRFAIALVQRAAPADAVIQLGMGFYWGALFGLCLCAGVLLADALLLRPLQLPGRARPVGRDARRFLVALGTGTLFAGLGLLLEALLNGLNPIQYWLVAPMGFPFALGLGLAIYGHPAVAPRPAVRTVLQVAAAGLISALTQLVFLLADHGVGITFIASDTRYRDLLPTLYKFMSPVEAALVGVALAVGIILGLRQATRRMLVKE